jgi:hypothetical protein
MKFFIACAAALTLALTIVACDSTPTTTRHADASAELDAFFGGVSSGIPVHTPNGAPSPVADSATPAIPGADDPSLDWADSCAANLDEITGALLTYYGSHRALPPTLDQIPKVAPGGERVSLTCPVSGKRYVYYPEGLKPPPLVDQNGVLHMGNLLILYDAQPSHHMIQHLTDGKNDYDLKKAIRFGIVMEPRRAVLGQPVQMYVVPIEQNLLDMYLRNAEQSAPAEPTIRRPNSEVW